METEEKQAGTGITEETEERPEKSLKPWVYGCAALALLSMAGGAAWGLLKPLDDLGREPTTEELEQLKYDSDRQERERKKAEQLRDQSFLLRDDDGPLQSNALLKGIGDEGAADADDGHGDDEEYEEEAIDHVLREPSPPAAPPAEPSRTESLPPMFVYSRAFGGARYVEPQPKPAAAQNHVSGKEIAKADDGGGGKASSAPEPEKENRVVYTGLPPVTLYEGEMLDAVLVNRLVADTEPSPVVCHLSRDLFDRSGRYVVLPANSRIVGTSQTVSYKGAHRLFIAFDRIILPGGPSIDLPSSRKAAKALDGTGALGVVSEVDRHWFLQFGTSIFFGVLDGLSAAAQRNREETVRSAVMGRASENFDRVLENIVAQYSSVVPTIRVDQGKTMKIYLADDILITPYARTEDRSYRYATR